MTRHQLHELLDQIPESEVPRLGQFIQDFLAEETLSKKDVEALLLAEDEIAQGETFTHAEVLARFEIESSSL